MDHDPFVYIVEDDLSVRHSLLLLLRSFGIAAAGHASAEEFLAAYQPRHPACIVADVRMPGMSGLDLQRALPAHGITTPVIIMTGHGDIAMAVEALKAGAADFIEKPCDEDRLLHAIRHAIAVDARNADQESELSDVRRRLGQLTEREREVMDLLVAGHANKGVAARLGISDRTVEVHRARIMHKTDTKSLSELVRMALRLEMAGEGG